MTTALSGFTIRVYGVLVNEEKSILVSDEFENSMRFTKFPGGGLELGEGIADCLRREWMEELHQPIDVGAHIYTTDFFQHSAFHRDKQVISVYYFVHPLEELKIKISETAFDYGEDKEGAQSFRWIKPKDFNASIFTFPIDQKVAELLRNTLLKF